MFIEFKKSGVSAVGSISAEISLPVRPLFNTSVVYRFVESEVQCVGGLLNYDDGSQDMLNVWFPKNLTEGKHRVAAYTGFLRNLTGIPKIYSLNGEVELEKTGEINHLVGSFNLHGSDITVVGRFDVKGIDQP
ncbi:hypothetical protein C4E44_19635 [Pseudomonas sp. MWU12-2312b]|nr:hypothetical protein C4E44_19635 [Pseudomonas sp. MWU12-2312b]